MGTSKALEQTGFAARRFRYSGPVPKGREVGFTLMPDRKTPNEHGFVMYSVAEILADPAPDWEAEDERILFERLATGRTWLARRSMHARCPGCGEVYSDAPGIVYVKDMHLEDMVWDGRVYELGPNEREHADMFHWRAWFQHDRGCNLPVSYAITEAQVLAWTDAYGPWRQR